MQTNTRIEEKIDEWVQGKTFNVLQPNTETSLSWGFAEEKNRNGSVHDEDKATWVETAWRGEPGEARVCAQWRYGASAFRDWLQSIVSVEMTVDRGGSGGGGGERLASILARTYKWSISRSLS